MSQDIRALFKAQATARSKEKSPKGSKKRAPIILEDEDEDDWQPAVKRRPQPTSGGRVKKKKRAKLESDSSEEEEETSTNKRPKGSGVSSEEQQGASEDRTAKPASQRKASKASNGDKSPSKKVASKSPSEGKTTKSPSKKVASKSPSEGKTAKSPSKKVTSKFPSEGKTAKSPSKKVTSKSPGKTKLESPSALQTSLPVGAKTTPPPQPSKSPKRKAREKPVPSLTDFFGSAPIKRSQPLRKPSVKRKEDIKKTEVIAIPESPADSPPVCLDDDLGLDEAEISQVLDDIEKEMEGGRSQQEKGGGSQQEEGGGSQLEEGGGSQQEEGGGSQQEDDSLLSRDRKRVHEKDEEDARSSDAVSRVSRTPPVKKLKRAVEAAEANKRSAQGGSSTPRQSQAKALGKSPQTPRAGMGTPISPGKGSTPTLNRGTSYRAYLQRSGPAHPGSKPIPEGKPNCLSGLTFVITGELDSLYRDQASSLIQSYGGRVTVSISKRTTHVLVGREGGESKLAKARSLGTKQISEDDLLEMVRSRPSLGTAPSPAVKKGVASKGKGVGQDAAAGADPVEGVVDDVRVVALPPSPRVGASPAVGGSSPPPSGGCMLWVDKHRPTSLKGVIGQQGLRSCANKLLQWLRDWGRNHGAGSEGGPRKKPAWGWGSGSGDGSHFKAALLSGPPGIGKTTTATLACKETGYDYTELNASDTRSKRGLAEVVATQLRNTSITAFTDQGAGQGGAARHAVIMDEVDGMSGNEDRGGMQELIQLIKTSQVPVICICNDRQHPKVRSLANHCFDLRFPRPRLEQIKGAMMSVAYKEGVQISQGALEEVILASAQDVRQVLHNLSLWTANKKPLTDQVAKTDASRGRKEVKLGPFDITRKLFSSQEGALTLQDRSNLFFEDYSFVPLFVQENYITARPDNVHSLKDHLSRLTAAADALAVGDVVEKSIRSKQNWGLLTLQAVYSCVLPSVAMRGYISPQVSFPQWLGCNSKRNRLQHLLQDLQLHTHIRTSCNKVEFGMDYLPRLATNLTRPLCSDSTAGVADVVSLMDHYSLTRDDWDGIVELSQFPGRTEVVSLIPSKVKGAFTRTYNKERHALPFAVPEGKKVVRRKTSETSSFGEEEEEEEEEEESVVLPMKQAPKARPSKGKTKAGGGSQEGRRNRVKG